MSNTHEIDLGFGNTLDVFASRTFINLRFKGADTCAHSLSRTEAKQLMAALSDALDDQRDAGTRK